MIGMDLEVEGREYVAAALRRGLIVNCTTRSCDPAASAIHRDGAASAEFPDKFSARCCAKPSGPWRMAPRPRRSQPCHVCASLPR